MANQPTCCLEPVQSKLGVGGSFTESTPGTHTARTCDARTCDARTRNAAKTKRRSAGRAVVRKDFQQSLFSTRTDFCTILLSGRSINQLNAVEQLAIEHNAWSTSLERHQHRALGIFDLERHSDR